MAGGAFGFGEFTSVLFAAHLCNVCRPSRTITSLCGFHGFLFCICHWFQLTDGHGQCIRHTVRPILRGKAVPYGRSTHAKSHACSFTCVHTSCLHLGKHLFHSNRFGPGSCYIEGGWSLRSFYDSQHFRICTASMPEQILAGTKYRLPNDDIVWDHHFSAHPSWLGTCVQVWSWKTWTAFSTESLHNVHSFLRLAIPSAVMVCLESWSFEMMVLLSGLLANPKLETSVLSICLNTAATVWMIPFGLSSAVSTRVSNELGAGNPDTARLAVGVVLGIATSEGVFVGMILLSIRNIWGYAYSNELEVVSYVATMMPILAASNFMDGLQCVLSGTVRGCGWQKIGAYINLGSYYLLGIPVAILLAFVLNVGGKGLWLGILCALVVQVVCLLVIISRANWELEAKKAKDRVFDVIMPVEISR